MKHSDFDKPPETLYKYISSERALRVLMSNRIYFAKLSEFNDPFDGSLVLDTETFEKRKIFVENMEKKIHDSPKDTPHDWEKQKQELVCDQSKMDEFARKVMNKWREKADMGFCCLTNNHQSLPMWAHYADNHAGCCLVFGFSARLNEGAMEAYFPFLLLKKIEYYVKFPKHNMRYEWHGYAYKSIEWEYEKEWRAIIPNSASRQSLYPDPSVAKKHKGAGLYQLNDNLLRGVILGYRMEECAKKDIVRIARQRRIVVYQAEPELYQYGMRISEISDGR